MASGVDDIRSEEHGRLLELWNETYAYDVLDEAALASILEGAQVVGVRELGTLVACACLQIDRARRTGFLSLLALDPKSGAEIGHQLLDLVCDLGRRHALIRIDVCRGGRALRPGVDVRDRRLGQLLLSHGFVVDERLHDVEVDLRSWRVPAPRHLHGYEVGSFADDSQSRIRRFVAEAGIERWWPMGWESKLPAEQLIVARRGDSIIGYATFDPQHLEFGPIAVAEAERDKGIGGTLLRAAMVRMRTVANTTWTARWVWPRQMYLSAGWQTHREYDAYVLDL